MAVDSTVLGTAGLAADVSGAGLRGFFAALPVLRLAPAVLATFFRATFFAPLPFVLCLAINVPSSRAVFWDHIAHRSLVDPEGRASPPYAGRLGSCQLDSPTRRARRQHDQRGRFHAGEPPSKCAGRERRIGSDHLQEPPAAERRNGVVRTEVGMLPTRGRADLGAFRQRGNRDVEIRSAPEQMIAGGRQGPI